MFSFLLSTRELPCIYGLTSSCWFSSLLWTYRFCHVKSRKHFLAIFFNILCSFWSRSYKTHISSWCKGRNNFFSKKFFHHRTMHLPSKNRTKKEPPISQKSLFYAISLKFICCLHCCLLHIKFNQIMLYMAHSSQSVCLFLIPITCIPDHP